MKIHHLAIIISLPILTASCSLFKQGSKMLVIEEPITTIDLVAEQKLKLNKIENELKKDRREMILFFSYDKDDVNEHGHKMLNAHVDYLKKNQNITIMIEGHADEIGPINYNYTLSMSRANKVKAYLTSKGVLENQIIVKARSESKLLDHTNTPKGRSFNRRVELVY